MQQYRFFEEYTNTSLQQSAGNVIAIQLCNDVVVKSGGVLFRALCADEDVTGPNSPVISTFFEAEYLGTHCRLVSEEKARGIHPKLFEYLDKLC